MDPASEKFDGSKIDDILAEEDEIPFDTKQTKALLRKVDRHLIPFLSLLYLLSFLDRTNIGNAKIFGLEKSLELEGNQYSVALCVFFITYVLFEVPSNMILKRWRASMWFPIMMIGWGVVMTLTGLVHNFTGLVVARLFLGITESGLFPGVNYYITLWYPRRECAFRAAIFFSAATVAGAFGGLLARGINEMAGLGGKPGWAWIFILEGLLTVVVAIVAFWVLADNPKTATFLTESEAKQVQARLTADNDGLSEHYDTKFMWMAFKDWKIWLQCLSYFGILTPIYSFSLFLPSIVLSMGFSAAKSQLMSTPPYVLGCLCTVVGGYFSDKLAKRGVFLLCYLSVAILGYVLLLASGRPAIQYTGVFFVSAGCFPAVPVMVMWNGNNVGGSTKRGVAMAMQIGFGNCGGVIASFIYRNQDRPRYLVGHGCCLGFFTMTFLLVATQMVLLTSINKRRDKNHPPPATYTMEQKREEQDLGDHASFFRYTI